MNRIIKKVLEPINLIICLTTINFLTVLLLLFFWFILSEHFIYILLDKLDLIIFYLKDLEKDIIFDELLNENETLLKTKSIESYNNRYNYNVVLLFTQGVIPYILVFILFDLILICRLKQINKTDFVLLILSIFSFIFEIMFYFILVQNWKFIGDNEFLFKLFKSINIDKDLENSRKYLKEYIIISVKRENNLLEKINSDSITFISILILILTILLYVIYLKIKMLGEPDIIPVILSGTITLCFIMTFQLILFFYGNKYKFTTEDELRYILYSKFIKGQS